MKSNLFLTRLHSFRSELLFPGKVVEPRKSAHLSSLMVSSRLNESNNLDSKRSRSGATPSRRVRPRINNWDNDGLSSWQQTSPAPPLLLFSRGCFLLFLLLLLLLLPHIFSELQQDKERSSFALFFLWMHCWVRRYNNEIVSRMSLMGAVTFSVGFPIVGFSWWSPHLAEATVLQLTC